jgi:hypothetical protein
VRPTSPEDRETICRSDEAFTRVGQTWESWKQVGARLVVLRNFAMRETGVHSVMSKRYKDRFHELLEQREYRSAKMDASTRKALLQCLQLAPGIDHWHGQLPEPRRLRLNHPVNVLRAFREFQDLGSGWNQSRQTRYDRELENIRADAAAAIAIRDTQIEKLQQSIGARSTHADIPDDGTASVVRYVIATCGGEATKIKQVIDALSAYLEHRA